MPELPQAYLRRGSSFLPFLRREPWALECRAAGGDEIRERQMDPGTLGGCDYSQHAFSFRFLRINLIFAWIKKVDFFIHL